MSSRAIPMAVRRKQSIQQSEVRFWRSAALQLAQHAGSEFSPLACVDGKQKRATGGGNKDEAATTERLFWHCEDHIAKP